MEVFVFVIIFNLYTFTVSFISLKKSSPFFKSILSAGASLALGFPSITEFSWGMSLILIPLSSKALATLFPTSLSAIPAISIMFSRSPSSKNAPPI